MHNNCDFSLYLVLFYIEKYCSYNVLNLKRAHSERTKQVWMQRGVNIISRVFG